MKTPEEIKEMAIELFTVMSGIARNKDTDIANAMRSNFITGYINAYTKYQKDNEEKVFRLVSEITTLNEEIDSLKRNNMYTLDDMKKACAIGIDIVNKEGANDFQPFEDLIISLSKKY